MTAQFQPRIALRLASDNWQAAKEGGEVDKSQEAVRAGNPLLRKVPGGLDMRTGLLTGTTT